VALGEEGDHLFDLDDLLGGAAEEAEERFAERLAENAEAGETDHAAGEVRIAAPGERVGERGEVAVDAEIAGERGLGGGGERGGGAPLEAIVGREAKLGEMRGPGAEPGVVGLAEPAEGLAAVEGFGQDVGGEGREVFEGMPGGPGGIHRCGRDARAPKGGTAVIDRRSRRGYLAGFSHRKLLCSARG